MTTSAPSSATTRSVLAIALAKVALHAFTSARGYGYFGDELYYLACARRLDWGYVDHPPLSIAVLHGWTLVFGESLAAIRMLAATFGGASVVLGGLLARELGGGARAQALTALVVALAPVHLVVHGYYSMNAIDVAVWTSSCVLIARLVRDPTPGRWLGLGALLGLGLLNKLSVLWLGAGFGLGLLVTPHRRLLTTPGPWLCGALALLVASPHLAWQVAHGFPTAEFMAAATHSKMVRVGPFDLLAQQALVMHPIALPLWVAGFFLLWRGGEELGAERIFAVVFSTTALILIVNGTSRPNYLALAQPPLVAAGAVGLERLARSGRLTWAPNAAMGAFAIAGLVMSVLTIPVLPPDDVVEFRRAVGLSAPRMERREIGELDPHFAGMIGWDAIVDAVEQTWRALPASERARTTIYAPDYGYAGAIEQLGAARGLPTPVSPHNSYWGWGAGDPLATTFIIIARDAEGLDALFARVEPAGQWDCGLCLPARNAGRIFVAREPKRPIEQVWNELRRYL